MPFTDILNKAIFDYLKTPAQWQREKQATDRGDMLAQQGVTNKLAQTREDRLHDFEQRTLSNQDAAREQANQRDLADRYASGQIVPTGGDAAPSVMSNPGTPDWLGKLLPDANNGGATVPAPTIGGAPAAMSPAAPPTLRGPGGQQFTVQSPVDIANTQRMRAQQDAVAAADTQNQIRQNGMNSFLADPKNADYLQKHPEIIEQARHAELAKTLGITPKEDTVDNLKATLLHDMVNGDPATSKRAQKALQDFTTATSPDKPQNLQDAIGSLVNTWNDESIDPKLREQAHQRAMELIHATKEKPGGGMDELTDDDFKALSRTTQSGAKFILDKDLGTGQKAVPNRQAAIKAGYTVVDSPTNDVLNGIDTARRNLQAMNETMAPDLATSPASRLWTGPKNLVEGLLQTNPRLSAAGTYRNAAIQAMREVAGSKGLRINKAEVELAINNDIPKATDTQAVAAQKLADMNKFLDNAEMAHVSRNHTPPPATGSQVMSGTPGAVPIASGGTVSNTPPPGIPPPPAFPRPAKSGQVLDGATAAQIKKLAGGDSNKALDLARGAGWVIPDRF